MVTDPIQVTRAGMAHPYSPPGHIDVAAHRLHGAEAGGPTGFWVGHSVYPPGARAELAPVAGDTVYIVLDGNLVLSVASDDPEADGAAKKGRGRVRETVLETGDSAFLPQGTTRSVENRSRRDATLLVVVQPEGLAP